MGFSGDLMGFSETLMEFDGGWMGSNGIYPPVN